MSVTSSGLEPSFVVRVRETSLVLCGLGTLLLLADGHAWPRALCFAGGTSIALLIWLSSERLGFALAADRLSWRKGLGLGALYFGKYALAAGFLWALRAGGLLDVPGFAVGFSVPGLVVLLKAVALTVLPGDAQQVPFYSKFACERVTRR